MTDRTIVAGVAGEAGGFTAHASKQARRLAAVVGIVTVFFGLELAGALVAGSVVLQAEALHLLMDILALGVSLFAMRLAVRRPTPRFTYGLRRAEPLAAIFSGVLVLATTALIVAEALDALNGHAPPRPGLMLAVATMALLVNGVSAWLLHDVIHHGHDHAHAGACAHDHEGDDVHAHDEKSDRELAQGLMVRATHGHALNLRGVWLHLLADALGAVAALVAALIIRFGGSPAADPIASLLVAAVLLVGALRLLRDAGLVLLEAAPPHMPLDAIRAIVAESPGVAGVHELHAWTLGAGHDAITVHVRTDSTDPAFAEELSKRIRRLIGAEYVTVQVETAAGRAEEP